MIWRTSKQDIKKKIQKIKDKLPGVNIDPLEALKKIFANWIPVGGMPKFELKSVTERQVTEMIDKMKSRRAFGRDRIDAATIKLAGQVIILSIMHVINLSLGTANYPMKWKLARILPLLKGKDCDKSNPASFRPVSLLPVISKLSDIFGGIKSVVK